MVEKNQNSELQKSQIIADFRQHEGDTGSSEVQIALLTNRIKELNMHLNAHKKDNSSRRGLMQLVAQRRKLLDYVRCCDVKTYEGLLSRLGIRK